MDRSTAETQRFGRGCLSRLSIDAAIPANGTSSRLSHLLGFSVLLGVVLAGLVGRGAAKDKPENECLGSLLRTAIARRHPTRAAGSATRARSAPMGVPPGRITETGTQPACLTDGMPHPATLVSVFCIPPSYNSTVDAAGDLPGPGAVALTGEAQLLP